MNQYNCESFMHYLRIFSQSVVQRWGQVHDENFSRYPWFNLWGTGHSWRMQCGSLFDMHSLASTVRHSNLCCVCLPVQCRMVNLP